MKSRFRLNGLDGIRGILALTVMLSHLVGSLIGWDNDRAFIGAYLSVVYFFMMSGFVLSYAHNKDTSFKIYFFIRLARLLPLHILSTAIIIIVFKYNQSIGGFVPNNDVFDLETILKNIFFLNGIYWNDFYIINAPSWSISIEFWASLLIPLLFNRIRILTKILLFIILFLFIMYKYRDGFQPSIIIATTSMLLGSICFELTRNKYLISFLQESNMEMFICVCLFGIYYNHHNRLDFLYWLSFFPVMFIDYTSKDFILRKILSSKISLFLGFVSFPLYLLHEIIIVSGVLHIYKGITGIILGVFLSLSVSYFYARFIDNYLYLYLKNCIRKILS